MVDRRKISIEHIWRAPTEPRGVLEALVRVLPALPDPGRAAVMMVGLPASEVLAQVGVAMSGKSLLDSVISAPGTSWGWLWAALGLGLLFFVLVRWRHLAQQSIAMRWRERCVERLSRQINSAQYEDLAAVPSSALRQIVMADAPFLTRFLVETAGQLVVLVFWIIAALAVLAYLSPHFLPIVALIVTTVAGGIWASLKRHLALTGESFRKLADLSEAARDLSELERIVLTRQFGLGDRFIRGFMKAHAAYAAVFARQIRLTATLRACIITLGALGFVGVVAVGSLLIDRGAIETGALFAALFVITQMLAAVAQLGDLAGRSAEAATAGKRISAYWEAPARDDRKRKAPEPIETVEARSVDFGYAGGPSVIENLSLFLRRGELVALTARTGAGKSTLALLLSGILEPRQGCILLNGRTDLRPADAAPGRILYVGPKPVLIPGSIRDNLFGGDPEDPIVAGIWRELDAQGRTGSIDCPVIGPAGVGVSSGQAQLIQLTRAVLRDPDVVIFDESTGALDMETETRVQASLIDWCRARVCLVISHRACPWIDAAARHERW